MRISDWSSDVCSSDLLSLPGPWPDVHGAHLTYRASEDSQANGHGGPTTSLRRDAIPFLVMPDWFRHPTLHERWRPRHIGPRNESGVTKIEGRSEEHTSELQSLMRISYAVFCLTQKTTYKYHSN